MKEIITWMKKHKKKMIILACTLIITCSIELKNIIGG